MSRVRQTRILAAIGSQILYFPVLASAFEKLSVLLEYGFYATGTICLGLFWFLRRHDDVKKHETIIEREVSAFRLRYPWRPLATAILISFGIGVIVFGERFDLTASQAFTIGIALWLMPHLVGDIVFGGRRS